MEKIVLLFPFVLLLCSCRNQYQQVNDLMDKRIEFPKNIVFTTYCTDTLDVDLNEYSFKIVLYVDSIGCTSCKMQLKFYAEYINTLPREVSFLIFVHPRRIQDVIFAIKRDTFPYPICIDRSDEFNRLNHLPEDDRLRCFLLDSLNRVILIGNPVLNSKIKDLYNRTISERLGIRDTSQMSSQLVHNEVSLGTLSKSETKLATFPIRNSEQTEMVIDTLFTSCECTTAQINKNVIKPNETATLSVTYTSDGIGDFYREVYVKFKNKEKPLVFKIRGTVK